MLKIYVHDYYVEPSTIQNSLGEDDFFYSINVYINFSPEDPGDGWDNLEYLNVNVANPFGLLKHLAKSIEQKLYPDIFFFPNLIVCSENNIKKIIAFIKEKLQSIEGKTESEILLKAIKLFSWEYETVPEVFDRLFTQANRSV